MSIGELQPSSSMTTGCVMPLRGDWDIFCHAGSGWVGRVWSARKKSIETLHHGWELKPRHREDRQRDTFVLPLSYHDPGHGEDRHWDSFIFPLSYHDPNLREDRQWHTFILPLSYHDPGHGEDRWKAPIPPLSYHDRLMGYRYHIIVWFLI